MSQNTETGKFIKKIYDIYVPIHGHKKIDNLFKNLTDNHLLNMIQIYEQFVFKREYKIREYIKHEKVVDKIDDFTARIYINAIQNYLYE
jgi:hypothetical protein